MCLVCNCCVVTCVCYFSYCREETEVTCGILKDLMAVSDPLKNLEKYHEYMLQGLQHPAPEVRVLVLAQVSSNLTVFRLTLV